jgi:small subunit ribosomal protein S6
MNRMVGLDIQEEIKLRRYETIFIAEPETPDEQVTSLVDGLSTAITEHQGDLIKTEDWGRKKLAYMVRKYQEGRFMRLEYHAGDSALPHDLERRLRMSEPVLKFMTVRIDNDKKRLVWEAKQAVKDKERAERRAVEEAAAAAAEAAKIAASEATAAEAPAEETAAPVEAAAPAEAGTAPAEAAESTPGSKPEQEV